MSKPARTQALLRTHKADGYVLTVQKRLLPQTSGTTSLELMLPLDEAPVPQRRYHADIAQVSLDNGSGVRLLFGQKRVGGKGLRSLIVVNMTPEGVRGFLHSCEEFAPLLLKFLERNGIPTTPLFEVDDEPEQTVSLVVNLVAAAQAGREVVLDMYHMSAWSLREVRERGEVAVDPVVRVDLSAALAAAVLVELHKVQGSLPEDVR